MSRYVTAALLVSLGSPVLFLATVGPSAAREAEAGQQQPGRVAGVARATDSAQSFIGGIYDLYTKGARTGLPLSTAQARAALLTPGLAQLFDTAEAQAANHGGALDFDLFVAAQEFQVTAVRLRSEPEAGADGGSQMRARVTASFQNFGEPTTIVYSVVRTMAGWRIDDIRSGEGGWLRQRLQVPTEEAPTE